MSGCRVFIGRLSPHARERDVEKFFKGYGRIREINLKNGFGFVEFDDHRDADDAVYELNGKELCSERVTIEHARSRRGRGGGPGMGRFGGGGGGGGGGYRPSRSSGSRYGPPVRTDHRLVVENLSSRTSWQVRNDRIIGLRRQRFTYALKFLRLNSIKLHKLLIMFGGHSFLQV
uniref:Serine and arginine rich splicing factor 5a n=1 Tax=Amphilophus citrinellus TaxID=61819 RepID=A0A3Q0RY36_AMPCI